jgi:histone H3/H4
MKHQTIELAKKYLKKCSTFLAFQEMQINVTLRFYLAPVRLAIIKKAIKCCQDAGRKNIFAHCWWECNSVHPLWKSA